LADEEALSSCLAYNFFIFNLPPSNLEWKIQINKLYEQLGINYVPHIWWYSIEVDIIPLVHFTRNKNVFSPLRLQRTTGMQNSVNGPLKVYSYVFLYTNPLGKRKHFFILLFEKGDNFCNKCNILYPFFTYLFNDQCYHYHHLRINDLLSIHSLNHETKTTVAAYHYLHNRLCRFIPSRSILVISNQLPLNPYFRSGYS
jgi:hypothetical protein